MMIDKLAKEQKAIVDKHTSMMADKYSEILKRNQDAISDQSSQAKFGLKLFERLNAGFQTNKKKMLKMSGAERIQLAEIWSRDANNLLAAIKDDPGYKSILENYNELIKSWQNEIKLLNEEISKTKDKEKLKDLNERKGIAFAV